MTTKPHQWALVAVLMFLCLPARRVHCQATHISKRIVANNSQPTSNVAAHMQEPSFWTDLTNDPYFWRGCILCGLGGLVGWLIKSSGSIYYPRN